MKKYLLAACFLSVSLPVMAQPDSVKYVNEINEQVWKPFIAHLVAGNQGGFRSVHSSRITRVEIDEGKLMDYEKYFPPIDPKQQEQSKKYKRTFELRFDKRISNGSRAWESGYYKGTVIPEGKEPRSYYGRFYVLLEKENGVWKILVDADTGKDATEENFNRASAMEIKQ
ncbi:MAG TPA: hypothetical protein PLZ45_01495 [Ferruginibacter sp.]|nr:hypothetical protein [Chitinophagaceae bacterium]HRI23312.1 hypothetical protein [Ferruginibacter sp.]